MSWSEGTIIVTGAGSGLGKAVAEEYIRASYPYQAIFTVRKSASPTAQPLKDLLVTHTKPLLTIEDLDLSVLSNIRTFAASVSNRVRTGQLPPIRALLLNAAVQDVTGLQFTHDGIEQTFAVNYLAHFLLVLLLLESMNREHGRIVFVSSSAHDPEHWLSQSYKPDKVSWRLPEELARRPLGDRKGDENNGGLRRYGASKLWLMMFMYELQRRLDRTPALSNISVLSISPGVMGETGLNRTQGWLIRTVVTTIMHMVANISRLFLRNGTFRTARQSAKDLLTACFSDSEPIGKRPKAIYLDGKQLAEASEEARDVDKQQILWEASLKLVGINKSELPIDQ